MPAPFHVLRLFCDEYIRYLVDCKIDEKRRQIEALTAASGALQQQHLMEQHVGHDQHSLHQQLHHQHDSMAVNAWPGSSQTPVGFDMFGGTSAGSNGAYLADMGHDFYRPQSSTLRGGYHAVAVVTPDVAQGMPSAGLAHYPMSSALTANDALGEESAHLNLDMADKAFAQAIGGELTHTEESVEQQ